MRQIRWLLDEDAQHRALTAAMRARGVDLKTVFEAGLSGADDSTVLAHAATEGRAVYTFNASDFCRLHGEYLKQQRPHAGIVVVPRQCYTVGEQLRRLFQLINARTADQTQNLLEFL